MNNKNNNLLFIMQEKNSVEKKVYSNKVQRMTGVCMVLKVNFILWSVLYIGLPTNRKGKVSFFTVCVPLHVSRLLKHQKANSSGHGMS